MAPSLIVRPPHRVQKTNNAPTESSSAANKPPRPVIPNPRKAMGVSLGSGAENISPKKNATTSSPHSYLSGTSQAKRPHASRPPAGAPQAPKAMRPHFLQNRQFVAQKEPWKDWYELSVILSNVPPKWGTLDIHTMLQQHQASPARIEMAGDNGRPGTARVLFRPPPPKAASWLFNGFEITLGPKQIRKITCRYEPERQHHQMARQQNQPDQFSIPGTSVRFGVMKPDHSMLPMRNIAPAEGIRLLVDVKKKHLELHLSLYFDAKRTRTRWFFSFRIPFTQLMLVSIAQDDSGRSIIALQLRAPPLVFRKTDNIAETHDSRVSTWDDRKIWFRQVAIASNIDDSAARITQLQNDGALIDIGRWLTYRFVCTRAVSEDSLRQLRAVLVEHNVSIFPSLVRFAPQQEGSYWSWLGNSQHHSTKDASSAIDQMNLNAVHLPFDVHYQLEACISHGRLHESNLSVLWAKTLLALDEDLGAETLGSKHQRATRLLEKLLESKETFDHPMDIFQLRDKVSLVQKKVPRYCTMVRSATVTPTTIYFHSPSMDTSNRIIRKYREHEDRFLRVKFRDESYKGTIMAYDDDTANELFTRVKRTMMNGIVVGDRHYEFLAYGNSQFREHGAYFFASTSTLTAAMIREKMGKFEDIKVVAKYASRVGQCFTTTRAMANGVTVKRIDDIERNGHCFTDGVGKISMFLAQMTAQEMGLSSFASDCPSVYQFRLGGCKGVLAVDPNLKGQVIEVRPSQEKFPADYKGLEICRVSKFSTAYLNQQIVLVLSALGVPDEVFLSKLRSMLSNLERAMTEETMALGLLQKNIDLNQSTVEIACMILEGFMATKDPFVITCLRLWRAWCTKYLKEKAKISVEQGAFVMGCVDETGTLKGHSNFVPASDLTRDETSLPEIFLQVPDPDRKGKFIIVQGVCTLARNPSLHPGDIRVVKAVDVPELHHLRNCVVLPQTGHRDIPSMCSGGDLDGDDYLVMWDATLLPSEWNHAPMDYSAPPPVLSAGPVTVDAMTSFFVQHMKNDNLGRIATAHRYWADRCEEGVKDPKCVRLAALHSKAVDYAKTGVPAEMPKDLRVTMWPHWAEKKDLRVYRSRRVLGLLYDEVDRVPFAPAWEGEFDERVLGAWECEEGMLEEARVVKREYDEAVRRVMAQYGIQSEFEVWTTFVLEHNHESRDFKIAEELGGIVAALKQQFQHMCYEKAGTTPKERDWDKVKPFVVAMYNVTAQELAAANAECEKKKMVAGEWVPARLRSLESMPLISFPWLFQRELGRIAKGSTAINFLDAELRLPATSPSISTRVDSTAPTEIASKPATPAPVKEPKALNDQRTRDEYSLLESRAFETRDVQGFEKKFAEINSMAAKSSGNFDGAVVFANSEQVWDIEYEQAVVDKDGPGGRGKVEREKAIAQDDDENEGEDEGEEEQQVTILVEKSSAIEGLEKLESWMS